MTEVELRALLPRHKCDCERAQAIIALGYPAVAPVLRDLLEWLQDCNWPVSHSIAPFLASVGEPVVPLIREVFRGNDDIWKYWCIERLIMGFPRTLAEEFRPELQRFAFHPTKQERSEELDERARAALEWLDGGGRG
jgi:Domain of unknown function (DUF5071)